MSPGDKYKLVSQSLVQLARSKKKKKKMSEKWKEVSWIFDFDLSLPSYVRPSSERASSSADVHCIWIHKLTNNSTAW